MVGFSRDGNGFGEALTWRVCAQGRWDPVHDPVVLHVGEDVLVSCYPKLVDIQWNVNDVAPEAIGAVIDWLSDAKSSTLPMISLGFEFGARNNEVFDSAYQAAARMHEINAYRDTTPFVGTMRKRLRLERAFTGKPDTTDMVECWLRLGGELRPDESPTLKRLMPKTMIFHHVANDGAFIYEYVGQRAFTNRVMGDDWSTRVIGRRAEDCFSDAAYENEVCADYAPVMETDEGRFHHLRAVINVPGQGAGWYNYERLTLPWTTPNGERVLMVFSAPSQNLDIPFLSQIA